MRLRSLHPPFAEDAARADGDERLQGVEPPSERIVRGVNEGQNALALVVVKEIPDDGKRNEHARDAERDDLPVEAGEENDGKTRDGDEHRRPEVGLLENESDRHGEEEEGHDVVPPGDVLSAHVVVPGQHERNAELHDFGGLDADPHVEPAGGPLDGDAEEVRREQEEAARQEDRQRNLLQEADRNHREEKHHGSRHEDVAQLVLDAPRKAVARRKERDEADRRERHDEAHEHQVASDQSAEHVAKEARSRVQ